MEQVVKQGYLLHAGVGIELSQSQVVPKGEEIPTI
jgi:hypothetical protein